MEILIILLVMGGLFFALRHMKKHKSACGGNCAGCTMDCKAKGREP